MEVPDQRVPAATFEELALPLFEQLYNFAHWVAQDVSEAEDLVQETYAKALRAFSVFQLGTNFRAWMFRILRNTFLTSRTGLKSTSASEDEVETIASTAPNPETVLLERADREMVRQARTELPVPFREVLSRCATGEEAYEDLAEVLAIPCD